MANTIDQAFIKQFETDVHLAYQRMGSKLRNTIRSTNVSGNVARFQKIGTGTASTKSRNGNVTPMELAHTNVEVTMADFYAAEFIDKLDELVKAKTVTVSKLMEIAPEGTVDPTPSLYNTTMYAMAGLLIVAFFSNLLMKPVHSKHFVENTHPGTLK